MMKRIWWLAAAPLLAVPLGAEPLIVSTTIKSPVCGAFYVDGVLYKNSQIFLWPEGSVHYIAADPGFYNNTLTTDVRCVMGGGDTATRMIVASRETPEYSFGGHIEYSLSVRIEAAIGSQAADFSCAGRDPTLPSAPYPPSPWDSDDHTGYVTINGGCFDQRLNRIWLPAGAAVSLAAFAPSGWAFTGWRNLPAGARSTPVVPTFTINGPTITLADFAPAHKFTFVTEPAGLQVLVDRTPVPTPYSAAWGVGTTHVMAAVPNLRDRAGRYWSFESWSQGGPEQQEYKVLPYTYGKTFTLRYVRGFQIGFRTNPDGLKLNVDGSLRSLGYSFVWGTGTTHTVAAPAEQAGPDGRRYTFDRWSNNGPAEQQITVAGTAAAAASQGLIAYYKALGRLLITSTPAVVELNVDGQPCKTPCDLQWQPGKTFKIVPPTTYASAPGTRVTFLSWSDNGPVERTWTAGQDAFTLNANYEASYLLSGTLEPSGSGSLVIVPASVDGYYRAGTEVSVLAEAHEGYGFQYWKDALDITSNPRMLTMSGPREVQAVLSDHDITSTDIAVRNAAGDTPEDVVAPGSMIAIYGHNLAETSAQNPDGQIFLAQTLAGDTVQVADRFLPLQSVTPDLIVAQLPSDLIEGDYQLTVHNSSRADVATKFTVRRNAPGLYSEKIDDRAYAVAYHEDGTPIKPDSPAKKGETITLLATGLGPYAEGALDGFVVPAAVVLNAADPVVILAGDKTLTPATVRAAAGRVGVAAVRLEITEDLPAASTLEISAGVKGADASIGRRSNTVLLPLE